MHQHHLSLLFLRQELTIAAEHLCCLVELNIGIEEREVAKIYEMILAELNLVEDFGLFCTGCRAGFAPKIETVRNPACG
jgi:hypothetical protein